MHSPGSLDIHDRHAQAVADLPAGEYRAAAALRAALRRFSQASDVVLRRHGLTNERYELLLAIKDADQRRRTATVSSLARTLGVAQVSVTQLVRRTEDAGLICREVSVRDARVRHLRLTRLGERRLAGALAELDSERSRLSAVIADHGGPGLGAETG
jgi:DNA-binding MarR family transcriptional regulator